MSNTLSSNDIDLLITYFQDDVDKDLKHIILRALNDDEIETLYARCLSMQTELIAQYLLREERDKRKSISSETKQL